jgi:hypothetical protein
MVPTSGFPMSLPPRSFPTSSSKFGLTARLRLSFGYPLLLCFRDFGFMPDLCRFLARITARAATGAKDRECGQGQRDNRKSACC